MLGCSLARSLARSPARAPSFNRMNHRADDGRVIPIRVEPVVGTRTRAANFPQEREPLPPPPPRDAMRRAAQLPHYTLTRSLPCRVLSLAPPPPHPILRSRSLSPTPPTRSRVMPLAASLVPSFSPSRRCLCRARRRVSLSLSPSRVGETPPMPHFTPSVRCFFLALAPAKYGRLVSFLVLITYRVVFF